MANLKPGEIGYLARLGKTEIRVWLQQTCCERAQRRNSEPSCRQRIQLLEDSGILRKREQKLRCVAVNGQSRHASGVRDVNSQQTTASEARYCANRRKLGELGYGGLDKQPSAVVEKTQSR